MRKTLLYISFLIASSLLVMVFVTSKTYTQLAIAVAVYPIFMFFAYKIFMKGSLPQNPIMQGGPMPMQAPTMNNQYVVPAVAAPSGNQAGGIGPMKLEKVEVQDIDKRTFLKLIGAAGLSFFVFSLLGRGIDSLLFGKTINNGISKLGFPLNQNTVIDNTNEEGYKISEIDDTNSAATYYGFVNKDGSWFVMKENIDESTYRYTRGNSDFSGNWKNRENLKYDYYYNLF